MKRHLLMIALVAGLALGCEGYGDDLETTVSALQTVPPGDPSGLPFTTWVRDMIAFDLARAPDDFDKSIVEDATEHSFDDLFE